MTSVVDEWGRMRGYTVEHWTRLGYNRDDAELIVKGKLPSRIMHWPSAPRYRVVQLERDGMPTEDAIAQARREWKRTVGG